MLEALSIECISPYSFVIFPRTPIHHTYFPIFTCSRTSRESQFPFKIIHCRLESRNDFPRVSISTFCVLCLACCHCRIHFLLKFHPLWGDRTTNGDISKRGNDNGGNLLCGKTLAFFYRDLKVNSLTSCFHGIQ